MRPKSEIYTPKRDNENPRPYIGEFPTGMAVFHTETQENFWSEFDSNLLYLI